MIFKVRKSEHDLNEMARVGIYDEVEVVIFTNDPGHIPHFHIRDEATLGSEFHCCVRLDKPEYFIHTGKEDKLNSKDKKDLINFLNQPSKSKRFNNFTNWQVLLAMWNLNNSDIEIDEDLEMPDYTKLS